MDNDKLVLSMDEAKQKLAELKKYMPDAFNELIYEFGRLLSEYLNPTLVPTGFVMGCELLLSDLQRGINGFTGQPIQSKLATSGYPPAIFVFLRMEIPRIAEAIFPSDFAEGVKAFIQEVNQEAAG